MAPWWSTAVNTGGSVVITLTAGSTSGPQAGSTPAGGGVEWVRLAYPGCHGGPHGLRAPVPCLAWPAPQNKNPWR
jgi:hypothetical protein